MSNETETRAQKRAQEEKSENGNSSGKKRTRKKRIRLIPIWLRLLLIVIFAAVSLVAGLVVGFGVIGEGDPAEVLKVETWQHIIDIVNAE